MIETLVALLLLLLVVQLTWSVTALGRRAAADLEDAAEGLAAERVAWWVLREELATVVPGRDRSPVAGDSVALRVFRGSARVCAGDGEDGRVRVLYRGVRRPDEDKDSVLVLGSDGAWRAADLLAVEGGAACGAAVGGSWERWRLGQPVPGALLLRVYEWGSYHLAGGALRYRRGAAGRQPLTPEVLAEDGTGLEPRGPHTGLSVRVRSARPGGTSPPWSRTLRPWGGGR